MITLPLAGRIMGLKSRSAAYRAAARGDLPTIRMCGKLFVPTELVLQNFDVDPDPLTGRRRQRTKGGYNTKKAAEQALAEAIGQWRTGRLPPALKHTLGHILQEEWLPAVKPRLRPSTWAN